MSNKTGLNVCLLLSIAAMITFFAMADDQSTLNWVVGGLCGVASGLLGVALPFLNKWRTVNKWIYALASLGIVIGWGSWPVIVATDPSVSPHDPIINITWFLAIPGGLVQVVYALTAARGEQI
ncbi:hypothetical protein QVA66_05555 [Staphylococcus chromogenes]|nr:hypothetical protein [Staphylococcus chromogenes]